MSNTVKSGFEYVEAWGMNAGHHGIVARPRTPEEVALVFQRARENGQTVGLRGGGNSYGDASMNSQGLVLEITGMNRLVDFDDETGVANAEAGFRIADLWREIVPRGYWPRVVSGTMYPTLAGAAAMNIHGKNNFAVGTIGDAIEDFDIVLPSGELVTANRQENADLFHAAIGGLGMLGVFTRIRLKTKKVYSGDLEVTAFANHDLAEMMAYFEEHKATSDYLVGWVDCFASGDSLGRGLIHDARYLKPGEDPNPEATLALSHQELPLNFFGVMPKGQMWRALRLFNHDLGMRSINLAKYHAGRMESMGEPVRQAHAAFAFLLDYVPNWKWAYGRQGNKGLIQYQIFLPKETAYETYTEVLERCHAAGIVPYLGVFKRHRPDPFWLTHAMDGWSFALDFKVTPKTRAALWQHCHALSELVLEAGGRFYFAKDSLVKPEHVQRMFPDDKLDAFLKLKQKVDPEGILQTDLWRRAFEPLT